MILKFEDFINESNNDVLGLIKTYLKKNNLDGLYIPFVSDSGITLEYDFKSAGESEPTGEKRKSFIKDMKEDFNEIADELIGFLNKQGSKDKYEKGGIGLEINIDKI